MMMFDFDLQKFSEIINLTDSNDTLENENGNKIIYALGGDDSIGNFASNVTIFGGLGNDVISHYSHNSVIDGGKGDDTINVIDESLIKGLQNIIQYAEGDGKDVIWGYNPTNIINIASGTYTTQNSGEDVVINVGSGSITLKYAYGSKLNIVSGISTAESKTTVVNDLSEEVITLNNFFSNADASSRSNSVSIVGSAESNSIVGSSGNDSLSGGAGNDVLVGNGGDDTLTGGAGKDLFIYKSGDNVITDYNASDDNILFTNGTVLQTLTEGSDLVLETDEGKLTLKNAATSQNISVTDSNGDPSVNK